jgi:lipopolysaccharide/colanic/teichoic acid biosynthesis glycosyltransferase
MMAIGLGDDHGAVIGQEPIEVRRSAYLTLKFGLEWLAALALLVACSPVLVALALGVRLGSSGPAFYAQTRLGRGGVRYRIYKLRTMVHDAEAKTGPVWASLRGDARITPLGKVLRATHLDELPQLWNVLRGEMALIGPRPERPEIAGRVERKVAGFRGRLAVRPGVTGLAQMLLPADDPSDPTYAGLRKKLALDLHYVGKVSAGLDLRIALATPCYFAAEALRAAGEAGAKVLTRLRRGVLATYARAVPEAGLFSPGASDNVGYANEPAVCGRGAA